MVSDPPNHPLSRRDTYHRTRHHVSLYDFKPEAYGFAPFDDVGGGEVVKVEPWRIKGEVVRGIGRGSKSLGIFGTFGHKATITPSQFKATYSKKSGVLGHFNMTRPR